MDINEVRMKLRKLNDILIYKVEPSKEWFNKDEWQHHFDRFSKIFKDLQINFPSLFRDYVVREHKAIPNFGYNYEQLEKLQEDKYTSNETF